MGNLNYQRAARRDHVRRHGTTAASSNGKDDAKAFLAAYRSKVAVHDPLFEATMQAAREHAAKRQRIHELAQKLAKMRQKRR